MHSDNYSLTQQAATLSIKKAQGAIEKILEMIDEGKYCPEVIQQVDAAIGLLKSSKKSLLTGHLDHCLLVKMKEDKQGAMEELVKIFDLQK